MANNGKAPTHVERTLKEIQSITQGVELDNNKNNRTVMKSGEIGLGNDFVTRMRLKMYDQKVHVVDAEELTYETEGEDIDLRTLRNIKVSVKKDFDRKTSEVPHHIDGDILVIELPAEMQELGRYSYIVEFEIPSDLVADKALKRRLCGDLVYVVDNFDVRSPARQELEITAQVYDAIRGEKGDKPVIRFNSGGRVLIDGEDSGISVLPKIGENGHWHINDVDTGLPARGAKGDQGDAFTYEDFTPEQLEELRRPVLEALDNEFKRRQGTNRRFGSIRNMPTQETSDLVKGVSTYLAYDPTRNIYGVLFTWNGLFWVDAMGRKASEYLNKHVIPEDVFSKVLLETIDYKAYFFKSFDSYYDTTTEDFHQAVVSGQLETLSFVREEQFSCQKLNYFLANPHSALWGEYKYNISAVSFSLDEDIISKSDKTLEVPLHIWYPFPNSVIDVQVVYSNSSGIIGKKKKTILGETQAYKEGFNGSKAFLSFEVPEATEKIHIIYNLHSEDGDSATRIWLQWLSPILYY